MSRTIEEIGMIVGGVALAGLSLALGPLGLALLSSLTVCNMMIGIGVSTAFAGTVGLLAPTPQTPSSLSPQGQLPIQAPNSLWRIVYGLFQFGGAVTFADGPFLDWVGTEANNPCENQYMQFVHTLCAHQIAGFVAVVLDGQTFNFSTDLVQITPSNVISYDFAGNPIWLGPVGAWGFPNTANPWCGVIWFEFDVGNANQGGAWPYPFPSLLAGFAQVVGADFRSVVVGSPRWTTACLQQGRAKVHVGMHYEPVANESQGGPNGAPHPYVLGSGRVPTIEFKILGRIIEDYRIQTEWQALTEYAEYAYVIAAGPFGVEFVFVQTNSGGGTSGSSAPSFSTVAYGTSVSDGTCTWLNVGTALYALGCANLNTPTFLNNYQSMKLQKNVLMADAWCGNVGVGPRFAYGPTVVQVIEAPIGYLQFAASDFTTGTTEPVWATTRGATTADGTGSWTCLGRSIYATCQPDSDGTENQGGFSNPALVIADYLQTPRNLFGLGAPLTADSIESIIAAANICDEPQPIEVFSDGTTLYERSFSCNGCFDTSSAYGDVLKALALSMAGYVVPPGDCWRVYAGSYQLPLITLGDDDARAPIKADFRLSARDTCNGVKGQYIPAFVPINPLGSLSNSPASAAWKKTDFPPVQSLDYIEEDGGQLLWTDISLDFTISLWMAQRIAKIVLERLRRQMTVSLPAKSTPLQSLAGDTVNFSHPRWESVNPPMPTTFFVSHLAARVEDSDGAPAVGVDLVLRQTDANVYLFEPPSSPTDFGDYSPYGQTGVGAGNVE